MFLHSSSLLLNLLTEDGLKDFHVAVPDNYLEELALSNNKVVGGVETAAVQCDHLNSLLDTAAVSILNDLYDLERMINGSESLYLSEMEKMTQDYICGRNEHTVLPTRTPEEVEKGED